MQPQGVVYLGSTIFPVVVPDSAGFTSMAIVTDLCQEKQSCGVLGPFDTEMEAYQCAIAFGKSEIERHRLLTLDC